MVGLLADRGRSLARDFRTSAPFVRCCLVILAASVAGTVAADLPISVPVRNLEAAAAQSTEQMPAMGMPNATPEALPTLPGGRLPQYQLDHHRRRIPTRLSGTIRACGFSFRCRSDQCLLRHV